jgi:nucleoside-diphosphate-sugar epimerase
VIKIESGKKYLITGGAGFLGGELIERILQQGGDVVTVSRNEGKLIELKSKYKDRNLDIHTGVSLSRIQTRWISRNTR